MLYAPSFTIFLVDERLIQCTYSDLYDFSDPVPPILGCNMTALLIKPPQLATVVYTSGSLLDDWGSE